MTATTAYADIRFAPRGELSEKQASWIGDVVAQAIENAHTVAGLQVDLVQLAKGEHKQSTKDEAIAVIRHNEAEEVASLNTMRNAATRATFGQCIEMAKTRRNVLGAAVARNRKAVAGMLAQRFGTSHVAAAPKVETVVRPGAYAVEYNGLLGFYLVEEGQGRWEGYTFLNRYHSDELGKVTKVERLAVMALIAADPAAAGQRFADETMRCYRCQRRLTDVEGARERGGLGPDCANK